MEELDKILIERYLAQEMSAVESKEFEQRLLADAIFSKEFNETKLAIEALKIAERDVLRKRFRERDIMLDRQQRNVSFKGRNLLMMAAIVTALIILAWLIYHASKQPYREEQILTQDSIQKQGDENILQDSTDLIKDEVKPLNGKGKNENTPSKKQDKGPELFASAYEPYMDESIDPSARSEEDDLNALDRFRISYWEGKFDDAVNNYQSLSPSVQQNDIVQFVYANALMATGKVKTACPILAEVVDRQNSVYRTEAMFYYALCQLHEQNYSVARINLESYIRQPDAMKKQEAEEILKTIQ